MLNFYLARYCSPTLKGVKAGCMFAIPLSEVKKLLNKKNELMEQNVNVLLLRKNKKNNTVLTYLYREDLLGEILSDDEVIEFLSQYGYFSGKNVLETLVSRFRRVSCPHEVGIFLNYPLNDVKKFIQNRGKNFIKCGYWKVYSDEEKCQRDFDLYDKCIRKNLALVEEGASIASLCIIERRESLCLT